MATAFITIRGGIINGAHHGDINAAFCDPRHEGCERVEVPFGALGGIIPGEPAKWYTAEWARRPGAELVAEGLMPLPERHVLDGGGLRPMTEIELHEAGIIVRKGMKIANGEFVPMTPRERLDAGQITRERYGELAADEAEAELQGRLADLMSPESMARAELDAEFAAARRGKLAALLGARGQKEWPLEPRWPE